MPIDNPPRLRTWLARRPSRISVGLLVTTGMLNVVFSVFCALRGHWIFSVAGMSATPRRQLRAGLYCRVSTTGQTAENQFLALRSFATARGWAVTEFVDHGQSGAKERRPALDALLGAVRARHVDVVACVKLDRLARSVHHLVALAREFEALGVDLVVLDQAIDTTTPSGRLLFHVLASVAEFERDLIRDRVLAGLRRAKAQGVRLGRPRTPVDMSRVLALRAQGCSMRAISRTLGLSAMAISRALSERNENPSVVAGRN